MRISLETYTYTEIANIILVLKITKGKNYDCLVVMTWKRIAERKRFKQKLYSIKKTNLNKKIREQNEVDKNTQK